MNIIIIGTIALSLFVIAIVWMNRHRSHDDRVLSSGKSESKRKIEHPNQSELDWIEENLAKARKIAGKEKNENLTFVSLMFLILNIATRILLRAFLLMYSLK